MNRILSCILLFLASFPAIAGGREGHGGSGFRCKTTDSWDFEVLDLYEARMETPSVAPAPGVRNEAEWIQYALSRFPLEDFSGFLWGEYFWVTRNFHLEENFPASSDYTPKIMKPGCELIQVANYTWDQRIAVKPIFEEAPFGTLSQAAIKVHEALYKMDRDLNGSDDSDAIRPLVALLFSDLESSKIAPLFRARFPAKMGIEDLLFQEGQTPGFNLRILSAPRHTQCTVKFGFPFENTAFQLEEELKRGEAYGKSLLISPHGKNATRRTRIDASIECRSSGMFRDGSLIVQLSPTLGGGTLSWTEGFIDEDDWTQSSSSGDTIRRKRIHWRLIEQ